MLALRRGLLRCVQARNLSTKEVTEVSIPVPWGQIAGKLWGKSDKQPILALHGWQDNASSFDYLIENLNIDRPVLAIDFPGTGFSSPTFAFFPYHDIDLIACVRWVQIYYGWKKLTIIGHSMGALIAFLFSGTYPDMVNGTISLDVVKPVAVDAKVRADKMGHMMDKIVSLMKRDDFLWLGYTKQKLEDRWADSVGISPKIVKKLMERGIREVKPGLFNYRRDSRHKVWQMHRWECSETLYIASKITCPVLLVKGMNSKYFDWSISDCPTILDTIKSSAKSFHFETVEGSHYLHMENPLAVAKVVERFLLTLEDEN